MLTEYVVFFVLSLVSCVAVSAIASSDWEERRTHPEDIQQRHEQHKEVDETL